MATEYQTRDASAVNSAVENVDDMETLDAESEGEVDNVEYDSYSTEEDASEPEYEQEPPETEQPQPSKRRRVTSRARGSSSLISRETEGDTPVSRRVRTKHVKTKNDYTWSLELPDCRSRRSDWTTDMRPSGKLAAVNVRTPLEAWNILITDEILEIIVLHTNAEIHRVHVKLQNENHSITHEHKFIDIIELKALIGLLYFAGLNKVNMTNAKRLWDPYGMVFFKCVMSLNRFVFLISCLRFDDKSTREERKESDELAAIREIWDKFLSNCTEYYEPGKDCTIGEQLLSFRGKCPFRVYMPNKSDKYGMKIVMMNDSATHYMYNAIPYVGTVDKDPDESIPTYYVRKLCEPIYGSQRNVTCDNWFTSIDVFDLMKKENITMVGTIRKNKREILASFKENRNPSEVARFYLKDDKVLVSYCPKPNKIVMLLSNKYSTNKIDRETNKPEIVLDYNEHKGGTDSFDKKCHDFTVARATNRWPMRFFFGMLDQCKVNAIILYNLRLYNPMLVPKDFILDLCLSLVRPEIQRRLTRPGLRTEIRLLMQGMLPPEQAPEYEDLRDPLCCNKMYSYKRCSLCPHSLDRKTQFKCLQCLRPMCKQHTAKLCESCVLR